MGSNNSVHAMCKGKFGAKNSISAPRIGHGKIFQMLQLWRDGFFCAGNPWRVGGGTQFLSMCAIFFHHPPGHGTRNLARCSGPRPGGVGSQAVRCQKGQVPVVLSEVGFQGRAELGRQCTHRAACVALRCVALCCVVMCCAVLCCVVLCCVVLCCVVLCCAVLCCVVLRCVVSCCEVFVMHVNVCATA